MQKQDSGLKNEKIEGEAVEEPSILSYVMDEIVINSGEC